jgi:lysophospholipase L1-like esterase
LNFGVYKYESCSRLAKQLDFSNFLFYNDNQDGFYEFAVQQNLIDLDNFHPNLQAHREWGAWIKERIREKI